MQHLASRPHATISHTDVIPNDPTAWFPPLTPEHGKAEEAKEAKLQAWLAIKIRFRGLTLGTVVRVSGRLLTLMVYEFPDQPGNLQ